MNKNSLSYKFVKFDKFLPTRRICKIGDRYKFISDQLVNQCCNISTNYGVYPSTPLNLTHERFQVSHETKGLKDTRRMDPSLSNVHHGILLLVGLPRTRGTVLGVHVCVGPTQVPVSDCAPTTCLRGRPSLRTRSTRHS